MMNMNKIAYNAIINNSQKSTTGRMNAVIPVDLLAVDPFYQRTEGRNERKLRKLKTEWDYNLMDALLVVPHPEEYLFYVVDGLGRLTVAKDLGLEELDCVIVPGPEDEEERQKFEAKYYLRQADCTETIKPVQKHNALILLGDPAALSVKELTERYNIEIRKERGQRSNHVLGSYDTTYNIAKRNGKEVLKKVFETLFLAGYMEEVNGLSSRIMTALSYIYKVYDIKPELVAKHIRNVNPNLLLAKATSKYPERGSQVTLTLYLQDFITEDLGVSPVFNSEGKIIKVA